eukprot:gene19627-26311_t
MKGGAYIGSGTYGCAVSPPVKCKDEAEVQYKHQVGKVFVSNEAYMKERENTTVMKKIDPHNDFTLRTYKACTVPLKNFTSGDQPKKCALLSTAKNNTVKQIIYEHGGVDITTLLKNIEEGSIFLDAIVPMMRPLFVGLKRLAKKKYVHFDIKLDNVMYNKRASRFALINFGLLAPASEIYMNDKFKSFWKFEYQWYPREFKLFYLLKKDSLSNYTFEEFETYFGRNMHYTRISEFHTDGLRDWFMFAQQHPVQAVDIIQRSTHKVDTYSLGMVLYIIVKKMHKYNRVKKFAKAKKLLALAYNMMNLDVRARIDPDVALPAFDSVVAEFNLSAFTKPISEKYHATQSRMPSKPFDDMTVRELRSWCDDMGLHTDGRKAELCKKLEKYVSNKFHVENETPYRGLLVYHGLGAGKTCAAITTANAYVGDRKVVVMLPALLERNFINEVKKCGPTSLRPRDLRWKGNAIDAAGIPYDELSAAEQLDIDVAMTKAVQKRYKFIHYNGLNSQIVNNLRAVLKNECVVIIDEVHNFISRVINNPYSLAAKLHKVLCESTLVKVVALSGTPFINYPREISYLINLVKGYVAFDVYDIG